MGMINKDKCCLCHKKPAGTPTFGRFGSGYLRFVGYACQPGHGCRKPKPVSKAEMARRKELHDEVFGLLRGRK